jgi:protein-tyrosine phosphatase
VISASVLGDVQVVWDTGCVAFSVLFVCTGNICRSPVAEKLLRAGLPGGADVTSSSAGTRALVDYPIDGPSAAVLAELGVDPAGHRARRLTGDMIASADLILTASTEHRRAVLVEAPWAMNCAFTLREFARLASAVPSLSAAGSLPDAGQVQARVALVARQRGLVPPPAVGADEIADPFGGSMEVTRGAVAAVVEALDGVFVALGLRGLEGVGVSGPASAPSAEQSAAVHGRSQAQH